MTRPQDSSHALKEYFGAIPTHREPRSALVDTVVATITVLGNANMKLVFQYVSHWLPGLPSSTDFILIMMHVRWTRQGSSQLQVKAQTSIRGENAQSYAKSVV